MSINITLQQTDMAALPDPPPPYTGLPYADGAFWNDRYTVSDAPFDWYASPAQLQHVLRDHLPVRESPPPLPAAPRALYLGCGTSLLGDVIADFGATVELLDISPAAVELQRARLASLGRATVPIHVGDVRRLSATFAPADRFDLIVDKGCLDALMCSSFHARDSVIDMLMGVHALLSPGGTFLIVSHGAPDTRLPLLQRRNLKWPVTHTALDVPPEVPEDDSRRFYVYTLTKAK